MGDGEGTWPQAAGGVSCGSRVPGNAVGRWGGGAVESGQSGQSGQSASRARPVAAAASAGCVVGPRGGVTGVGWRRDVAPARSSGREGCTEGCMEGCMEGWLR